MHCVQFFIHIRILLQEKHLTEVMQPSLVRILVTSYNLSAIHSDCMQVWMLIIHRKRVEMVGAAMESLISYLCQKCEMSLS